MPFCDTVRFPFRFSVPPLMRRPFAYLTVDVPPKDRVLPVEIVLSPRASDVPVWRTSMPSSISSVPPFQLKLLC